MIVQVAKRAREAAIGRIVVAVDHDDTFAAVANAGFEVVMTRKDHQSGSDRIYEALQAVDPEGRAEIVVNVQGDLPTIDPETIRASLRPLEDPAVDIATLTVEIKDEEEKTAPSVVKVVGSAISDNRMRALYFTRTTAPYGNGPLYHHIGLYAYRRAALEKFVSLGPSPLERRESLACASMLRSLTRSRSVSILPPTSKRPDVSFPPLLSDGIPPKAVP
jgi:3-deoxy-manno-octulosonate cytidylyltransferase (CMP-KDO synthetase)